MRRSRFNEGQIIGILKESAAGATCTADPPIPLKHSLRGCTCLAAFAISSAS